MGDGIIKRFAVIISGDADERFIQNVERSAALFEEKGYDVHIASRGGPFGNAALYPPTKQGINEIVTLMEAWIDDDDEIVIHTTGHGGREDGGCLVLEDGCLPMGDEAFRRLNALRYGERTVIMNQCYAGNWARLFAEDPKTLFISAGSQGELVASVENFMPWIIRPDADVRDANGDGTVSWQERYGEASAPPQYSATLFLEGQAYEDNGVGGADAEKPRFASTVQEVTDPASFKRLIKGLNPGDLAVVCFSDPRCAASLSYRPRFDELAKSSNGRALFLLVTDSSGPEWDRMGIGAYPTVRLYDGQGRVAHVDKLEDPLAEIWRLSGADPNDPAYWASRFLEGRKRLRRIPPQMFGETVFIKAVRERIGLHRDFLLPEKRGDRAFVLGQMESNADVYFFIDPSLKSDRTFILEAVRRNPRVVLNLEYRSVDHQILLEAVRRDGRILGNLCGIFPHLILPLRGSPDWQENQEVTLAALASPHPPPNRTISTILMGDKDFALKALERNSGVLELIDPALFEDRSFALAACRITTHAFAHLPPALQNDPEIRRAAGLERVIGR